MASGNPGGAAGAGGSAYAEARDGTTQYQDGGNAHAVGGDGGRGGSLLVLARQQLNVAHRQGALFLGNGGTGGAATSKSGSGGLDGVAGLSDARQGMGGSSGNLWISHIALHDDRLASFGASESILQGGAAGKNGTLTQDYGVTEGAFRPLGFLNPRSFTKRRQPDLRSSPLTLLGASFARQPGILLL